MLLIHLPESSVQSSWCLLGCKTALQIPSSEVFCGLVLSSGGFFVGGFFGDGI